MRRDYRMIRGVDLVVPTRVARKKDGSVINLTGATVIWRVGPYNRLSTGVELDTAGGVIIISAIDGTYSRVMAGAYTTGLIPGRFRHTVRVTETDGSITTVEEGFIDIERDLP